MTPCPLYLLHPPHIISCAYQFNFSHFWEHWKSQRYQTPLSFLLSGTQVKHPHGLRSWTSPTGHQKIHSEDSHRSTQFSSIFAKSPPPTFLLLMFPLEESRYFKLSFPNRLFYYTIRKCKLSFPLWETFLLQTAAIFDTNTLLYIKSKPSKDGTTAPARILQLQGSQSILHLISDAITITMQLLSQK